MPLHTLSELTKLIYKLAIMVADESRISDVVDGLTNLHGLDIVHGDLKGVCLLIFSVAVMLMAIFYSEMFWFRIVAER